MATSLRDNLTSSYFNAAHKLYSKKARRRIIAYVESYDDIAFWRTLLEEFEDDEHYFQVMLPSANSLAKGKKMVLMTSCCREPPILPAKSTGTNTYSKPIRTPLRTTIVLPKACMKYAYKPH